MPNKIHSDRENSFRTLRAVQRFTGISCRFINRDIFPVFSDKAHRKQDGKHE